MTMLHWATGLVLLGGLAVAHPGFELRAQEPASPPEDPPVVVEVVVTGLDRLDPPVRLPRRLPLRPGEPYTLERLEAMDAVVVQAFAERGHPYVGLEASLEIDREAETARIELEVTDPGPEVVFGPIQVTGAPPLDPRVIRERVTYAPGDPYQPSRMEETRDRLVELPIVAEAAIFPIGLETGETEVGTVVSAAPVPDPREPTVSATLTSSRCLELGAFWLDRYFLDGPRFLSVGAGAENLFASTLGNRFPCSDVGEAPYSDPGYFVSAELRHPWPGSPRTTVSAGLSLERTSVPQAYVRRSWGGRVSVRRIVGRDFLAEAAYVPERVEIRGAEVYFCATFGACTAPEIEDLQDLGRLAPVEVAAQWIPRRTREAALPRPALPGLPPPATPRPDPAPLDPRWRPWLHVELQGAGRATGSRVGWMRLEVEGAIARFVGDRSELVFRGRAGIVGRTGDILPPQAQLHAGGPESVRGVEANLLAPLVLITSPEEAAELGCTVERGGCPENLRPHPDRADPRPRGGHAVGELGAEARWELTSRVQVAGFVDYGLVRANDRLADSRETLESSALTPGAGLRLATPIGLLRVDAGYDPRGARTLPLLTHDPEDETLIHLGDVVWVPHERPDQSSLRRFLRRIRLSVGVGQPF